MLILIIILIFVSVWIWTGYYLATEEFRARWPGDESIYECDNISYPIFVKLEMLTRTTDGFFVCQDIALKISHAYIEYRGDVVPKNDTISLRLYFDLHIIVDGELTQNSPIMNATYNGDNKFEINYGPQLIIRSPYRGDLLMKPVVLVNGEVVDESIEFRNLVTIEPAYLRTQLILSRIVVILTIWLIFFSTVTIFLEIERRRDRKLSLEHDKEQSIMLKTILKSLINEKGKKKRDQRRRKR